MKWPRCHRMRLRLSEAAPPDADAGPKVDRRIWGFAANITPLHSHAARSRDFVAGLAEKPPQSAGAKTISLGAHLLKSGRFDPAAVTGCACRRSRFRPSQMDFGKSGRAIQSVHRLRPSFRNRCRLCGPVVTAAVTLSPASGSAFGPCKMELADDLWRPSARSMLVLFSTSVGLIVDSGAPEASLDKSIGFVIGINGTYRRCHRCRCRPMSAPEIGFPISAAMSAESIVLAGARRTQGRHLCSLFLHFDC